MTAPIILAKMVTELSRVIDNTVKSIILRSKCNNLHDIKGRYGHQQLLKFEKEKELVNPKMI